MSLGFTPPPVTGDMTIWAQNLVSYLRRTVSRLQFKSADASAVEDGVILWDAASGYPVVSKDSVWRQVVLADGYGICLATTTQTATAINTAQKVVFDTVPVASGVSVQGSPATRITVAEGGVYEASFSCQLTSTSASAQQFWTWLRINGTDLPLSQLKHTVNANNGAAIVSRTVPLPMAAGDYLEIMWAVDNTNLTMTAAPATAFAPVGSSCVYSLTRIRA